MLVAGGGDLVPVLGLLTCLVLALAVRTGRKGGGRGASDVVAAASVPVNEPSSAVIGSTGLEEGDGTDYDVAAGVRAALAGFGAKVEGERAIRLEEAGGHLTWAVTTLAGIARGRAGEVRTIGPALAALECGEPEPGHGVLSALAAVEPAAGAALARAQAAIAVLRRPALAMEPARRAVRLMPAAIEAWSLLGIVAEEVDDREAACVASEKVLTLAVRPGDRGMQAAALGTLGEIYRRAGALDRAEEYLRIALTYQLGMAQPGALVRHYRNLGRLYQARGDWAGAAEAVAKALAVSFERSHSFGVAELEVEAGVIAARRGASAEAGGHWAQARRLYLESGHSDKVAEVDALIAHPLGAALANTEKP